MGLLVDGHWQDKWYDTESNGGRFKRENAGFRNWVTVDGSAGPSGQGGFKAEANRYHLYVSLACPWANRTTIYRRLKGLKGMISMSVVHPLFNALDTRLAGQRYLLGDRITEADWRLFTTLVRCDAVYVGHFKCNIRCIIDYPNLWGYLRDLYQIAGVKGAINMQHIKAHYDTSHTTINPTGIIPTGPVLNFDEPHERAHL